MKTVLTVRNLELRFRLEERVEVLNCNLARYCDYGCCIVKAGVRSQDLATAFCFSGLPEIDFGTLFPAAASFFVMVT